MLKLTVKYGEAVILTIDGREIYLRIQRDSYEQAQIYVGAPPEVHILRENIVYKPDKGNER